jgi:hypothetical protein
MFEFGCMPLNTVTDWKEWLDSGHSAEHPSLWWARLEGASLEALWHKTTSISDVMAEATAGPECPTILPILKSTKNAFAMGITLGRVSSNDVVIEHPSVSRFHAWMTVDESGHWRLFDADSQNGTWMGSLRASSKQGLAIEDTTTIRIGHAHLVFLLPRTLEARVRKFESPA